MTIWRGEGGGGDATTDSEINFITSLTNSIVDNTAITTAAADATAALYDSFDDRYLGSKAAAPTLDNDSNALIPGALYWNSVSNQMFVWSGTAWQQTFFSGTNVRSVVTATAGQTVVTTPSYTQGNNTIQVYVNGFKVISGTDYTETSTTSITFTSGLTLSDEVEILIAQPFSVGITSSDAVNYLPAGTGAVATTVQAKLRESVSVKDFGALGNGTTDDTTAIQAAITAVQGSNVHLFFPPGTYKLTASLNVTAAVAFVGASTTGVTLSWTSTSLTVFNVNTNSPVEWRNLTLSGPASPVSGSVIALTGSTGNAFSVISDCTFVNSFNGVNCTAAYALKIVNCYFYNFINYGVHIQNTYNADAGDSSIVNCIFAGPTGGSNICVFQESSGGLRLIGNKFNTGGYNYKLSLTTSAITSDLLINANSFENATTANVQLTANVSGTFGNIVITGNQFALAPSSLLINPTYAAFSRAVITGNSFSLPTVGVVCVSVDYVSFVNIEGNSLFQGGGTTATGILIGSNTSGNVGVNTFSTGTWTEKITNSSGSVAVMPNRFYSSSQAVTCSTAFGSLFSASGSVTFPITFASTPTVTTSPNSISGGIAVSVYSVSTTGFSYTALSITNGGAGSFTYTASGVY